VATPEAEFLAGSAITYTGFDDLAYVASFEGNKGAIIKSVVIRRADGSPVVARGKSYPAGYVAGHGESFARTAYYGIRDHEIEGKENGTA
jgi:hypothetical protein